MIWSRRQFVATGGALVLGALGAGCSAPASLASAADEAVPPGTTAPDAPGSADEARRAGWAVVTDHGAIGDGRAHPLRGRYPDLAAARRDHPSARSLDDELDGAAIQTLIDSGAPRLFYPAGHYRQSAALVVRSGQRHLGAGPATLLENVRTRATSYDWVQAHSFQIGDIHPVAMQADRVGVGWATRRLAPIAAGDRSVTVLDPIDRLPEPGEVVMVRCDNPPFVDGEGLTYDLEVWNRVVAWDPAARRLDLEDPVPRAIAAGPGPARVPYGPTLCRNDGSDYFLRQPWSIAADVEIGGFALDSAGFSARNGVWRGWFHDLAITGEQMITFNALVHSVVERVTGTFTARMIEVKHASRDSTVREVHGTYRDGPSAIPLTQALISIGEQSFACEFDAITCVVGPDCTAAVRALDVNCSGIRFRGTLEHHGTGRFDEVWAIADSNGSASPPTGLDLDLTVRARSGLRSYGLIGNPVPRVSDPSGVTLRLDQRTDGAPPRYALVLARGRGVRVLRNVGDRLHAAVLPAAEPPDGMPVA